MGGEEQKYRHGNSNGNKQKQKHTLYSYLILLDIEGSLKVQLVPFNACTHLARWFCGNAHSLGWFDFIVIMTDGFAFSNI